MLIKILYYSYINLNITFYRNNNNYYYKFKLHLKKRCALNCKLNFNQK